MAESLISEGFPGTGTGVMGCVLALVLTRTWGLCSWLG